MLPRHLAIGLSVVTLLLAGCTTMEQTAPSTRSFFEAEYESDRGVLQVSLGGPSLMRDHEGALREALVLEIFVPDAYVPLHVYHLDLDYRVLRETLSCRSWGPSDCQFASATWADQGSPAPFGIGWLHNLGETGLGLHVGGEVHLPTVEIEEIHGDSVLHVTPPLTTQGYQVVPKADLVSVNGTVRFKNGEDVVPNSFSLRTREGWINATLLRHDQGEPLPETLKRMEKGAPLPVSSYAGRTFPGMDYSPTDDGVTMANAFDQLLEQSQDARDLWAEDGSCLMMAQVGIGRWLPDELQRTIGYEFQISGLELPSLQATVVRETWLGSVHQWHVFTSWNAQGNYGVCSDAVKASPPAVAIADFTKLAYRTDLTGEDDSPRLIFSRSDGRGGSGVATYFAIWDPPEKVGGIAPVYDIMLDGRSGVYLGMTAHPDDVARLDTDAWS